MLEVAVGGEGLADLAVSHDDETHGVAEGVRFVQLFGEQLHRVGMKCGIDPNDFDLRIVQDAVGESEGLLAGRLRAVARATNSARM